jgi:hypothetical protein
MNEYEFKVFENNKVIGYEFIDKVFGIKNIDLRKPLLNDEDPEDRFIFSGFLQPSDPFSTLERKIYIGKEDDYGNKMYLGDKLVICDMDNFPTDLPIAEIFYDSQHTTFKLNFDFYNTIGVFAPQYKYLVYDKLQIVVDQGKEVKDEKERKTQI